MPDVRLEITFKSGATVEVDVAHWEYAKSALGTNRQLTWRSTDARPGNRRLVTANIDEIAAIVEVLPDDWTPDDDEGGAT